MPLKKFTIFLTLTAVSIGFSCSSDDDPGIPRLVLLGKMPIPGSLTTDVWGYVEEVTGKEFALVGDFSDLEIGNLTIVNVSNPLNPEIVSVVDGIIGFDVKVWDHYAFVANGGSFSTSKDTLSRIINLSDIENPQIAGSFEAAHNCFIDDQGYLYLAGAGPNVRIFNLNNDPLNPEFVWTDGLGEDGSESHDIAVVRNRMYDFHGGGGTYIYDVLDPQNPVLLGLVPYLGFNHSGWTTGDGNFLFIMDELVLNSEPEQQMPGATIWNITDPANPFKTGEIIDQNNRFHNVYIKDQFAFVSNYGAGIRVYQISDPSKPALMASFVTNLNGGNGLGGGFLGAFGVYPFLPSGNILVSDMDNGLLIFSFR